MKKLLRLHKCCKCGRVKANHQLYSGYYTCPDCISEWLDEFDRQNALLKEPNSERDYWELKFKKWARIKKVVSPEKVVFT